MTTARPSGEIFTSVKPTKLKNSSSVSLGLSVARAGTRARNKTKRDRLFMGHRVISTSSSNWQSGGRGGLCPGAPTRFHLKNADPPEQNNSARIVCAILNSLWIHLPWQFSQPRLRAVGSRQDLLNTPLLSTSRVMRRCQKFPGKQGDFLKRCLRPEFSFSATFESSLFIGRRCCAIADSM